MRSSFGEANWNVLYKLTVTVRDTPRVSLSRFPSFCKSINQSINQSIGNKSFSPEIPQDSSKKCGRDNVYKRSLYRPPNFNATLTELLTRVRAGSTKTVHLPCPPPSSRPDRQRRRHQ